jgi:hypothetical protein
METQTLVYPDESPNYALCEYNADCHPFGDGYMETRILGFYTFMDSQAGILRCNLPVMGLVGGEVQAESLVERDRRGEAAFEGI